jgi:O-antigen ligase
MLTAFKELLHGVVPLLLYLAIFIVIGLTATKRVQWGMLLLVALVGQPNLWYKIHVFPLGTRTMDLLFVAIIIGISVNGGKWQRPPRTTLFALYGLWCYLALWHTALRFNMPMPVTGANHLLQDLKNYLEMLGLYFLAYNALKNEKDQKQALLLLVFVVLFIAIREIRNFDAAASFSYDKRAAGPFWVVGLGSNHFAAFIAYLGSFIMGLLLCDKDKKRKWLYIITLVCLVTPLFNTYSRGAYAAVLLALFFFGVVRKRSILIGLVVLGAAWQTLLPPAVVERITMTETSDGQIEESAALRLVVWERAKQLFVDNPVAGIGYGGFGVSERIGGLNNVHNYYMQTAAEQGVIGLLFLAVILMRAGVSGWRLYCIGSTDFHKGIGLGFAGAVVAVMVSNIFGDRWSYFALGAYFWVLWGIVDRSIQIAMEAKGHVGVPAAQPLTRSLPERATA